MAGKDGTVDGLYNIQKADCLGSSGKDIATFGTSAGICEMILGECLEDFRQIPLRHAQSPCDLLNVKRRLVLRICQVCKSMNSCDRRFGNLHRSAVPILG